MIGASGIHDPTPPIPNLTQLASSHPHNKVVVSDVTRVFLAPPLQADVEYYYHRLSRPTSFFAISINSLSSRHQITTLHVYPSSRTLKLLHLHFPQFQIVFESPSITPRRALIVVNSSKITPMKYLMCGVKEQQPKSSG
ncbi:hypothetical protein A2U01_0049434 [Trifolium medium]|uniref:Uncharacterized protein n=1 Tax=Trifolium medium TaxID=97028 RepID=A0A392QWL0_9FABA|nr:hypothetical protein [Trifolium medium]